MKRRSLAVLLVGGVALGSGCATGFTTQPTYVTDRGATLNGFVLSTQGGPTDYWAEWGETKAYGERSGERRAGANPTFASFPIRGLSPETTYHYRLCARDQDAATCSHDATFRTRPPGGRSGIAFFSNRGLPGVYFMNADGSGQTRLSGDAHSLAIFPTWSPDATRIAFTSYIGSTNFDVFAMDAAGGNGVNLTDDPASDGQPAWSPDGARIAFVSNRTGNGDIYLMDADGGNPTPLTNTMGAENSPAWSPDGRKIAFEFGGDIWTMNADGTERINLTTSAGLEESPSWSPDGTRIAFASNAGAAGDSDVFVMSAQGGAATNLTNFSEGFAVDSQPSWSPDGSRIAFMSNRVPVDNAEIFVMDADGDNPVNVSQNQATDQTPVWSPRP